MAARVRLERTVEVARQARGPIFHGPVRGAPILTGPVCHRDRLNTFPPSFDPLACHLGLILV